MRKLIFTVAWIAAGLALVVLVVQAGCAKSPPSAVALECEHCMGSCAEDCAGCRAAIMAWSE